MLRKLGMAPKDKSTLPYDPEKKVYYTKIMSGLTLTNQLIIYHRSDKISNEFVNKADSTFFTDHLTDYERKNLLPKDYLIISPDVVDQSIIDQAGKLYRQWNPSHGVDINNAILAATAMQSGGKIYCLNTKHYPFKDVTVQRAW